MEAFTLPFLSARNGGSNISSMLEVRVYRPLVVVALSQLMCAKYLQGLKTLLVLESIVLCFYLVAA